MNTEMLLLLIVINLGLLAANLTLYFYNRHLGRQIRDIREYRYRHHE